VSSALKFLDSGFRRNDNKAMNQCGRKQHASDNLKLHIYCLILQNRINDSRMHRAKTLSWRRANSVKKTL